MLSPLRILAEVVSEDLGPGLRPLGGDGLAWDGGKKLSMKDEIMHDSHARMCIMRAPWRQTIAMLRHPIEE